MLPLCANVGCSNVLSEVGLCSGTQFYLYVLMLVVLMCFLRWGNVVGHDTSLGPELAPCIINRGDLPTTGALLAQTGIISLNVDNVLGF